jgi:putative membrane protein
MVISFVALYVLDKARNGAILAVSKILEGYSFNHLVLFIAIALIVGAIATPLTLNLAKLFSKIMTKLNYQKLCIGIILLIVALVTIISGPLGLFVLIIASFIGILPALKGVGRNHLMGCLILPVILYFIL